MKDLTIYSPLNKPDLEIKTKIINFLHKHLEGFGDSKEDIKKSADFALKEFQSFGGLILVTKIQDCIVGVVIVNHTGMSGYIPENILVYIAVHNQFRGQKIGKFLMKKAIESTEGDIALHVEPNNPAKFLYEKVKFSNKYLEMRYKRGD